MDTLVKDIESIISKVRYTYYAMSVAPGSRQSLYKVGIVASNIGSSAKRRFKCPQEYSIGQIYNALRTAYFNHDERYSTINNIVVKSKTGFINVYKTFYNDMWLGLEFQNMGEAIDAHIPDLPNTGKTYVVYKEAYRFSVDLVNFIYY